MGLISQNLHTHSHGKQWHRAHTLNLLFVASRCVRNTSRLCETPRISRRSFVPLLWNLPIRYEALWSLVSRLRRCYPCPVWYCNGIADQYEFGLYYCADPLGEILPAGIGTLTMLTGRLHPCVSARTHAPPPRVVVDGGSGSAVGGKKPIFTHPIIPPPMCGVCRSYQQTQGDSGGTGGTRSASRDLFAWLISRSFLQYNSEDGALLLLPQPPVVRNRQISCPAARDTRQQCVLPSLSSLTHPSNRALDAYRSPRRQLLDFVTSVLLYPPGMFVWVWTPFFVSLAVAVASYQFAANGAAFLCVNNSLFVVL